MRTLLGNLSRAGLITINNRSPARTVLVHELVQALTRKYLPAAQVQRAARAAADALAQAWSDHEIPPSTAQALRDSTAKLQDIAGAFLMSSECHPDSEQALGPHHPITQSVREDLDAAASTATSVLGIDLRSPRSAKAAPPSRSLSVHSGQISVVVADRRGYARAE